MCNHHHQVCRRIQGMQHSLKWMQCRHSWSIPDHCPEITTVPIQVKNERNTLQKSKYRGNSSRKHCVSISQVNAFNPADLHGEFRHRQGLCIKVHGVSTNNPTAPMGITESGYLPQEHVHDLNNRIWEQMAEPQQTTCRHWSIPCAWLHGPQTT